ncbi:hypothetical protein Ahy_A05g022712 [Arachis hypogaea]|uniref:Major facilitator superfamily (MFS) profile domain-containing protein n=1 Tax=Arachis hypogaea TaxID=3818 RepID=A0A445D1C1_ARAHY|nr:hypothetical protein Ahy_A05g022712 [Arachis hypogaea]
MIDGIIIFPAWSASGKGKLEIFNRVDIKVISKNERRAGDSKKPLYGCSGIIGGAVGGWMNDRLGQASPTAIRGAFVCINDLLITFGQFLSYIINLEFTKVYLLR